MHGIFGTAHFPSCRQLSSLVHIFLSLGCTAEQSQDRKSSVGSACAARSHRETASLILHHSFLLTPLFLPWSGYLLSMGQAWTRHPALALVGTLTALWNREAPSQQYLTEMFQNKALPSFSKGAFLDSQYYPFLRAQLHGIWAAVQATLCVMWYVSASETGSNFKVGEMTTPLTGQNHLAVLIRDDYFLTYWPSKKKGTVS